MNKRVKIVSTLGPAVEIRGGKKFGESGYWGESLDVEASAKNIAALKAQMSSVSTSHTVTILNKVLVWQQFTALKKSLVIK